MRGLKTPSAQSAQRDNSSLGSLILLSNPAPKEGGRQLLPASVCPPWEGTGTGWPYRVWTVCSKTTPPQASQNKQKATSLHKRPQGKSSLTKVHQEQHQCSKIKVSLVWLSTQTPTGRWQPTKPGCLPGGPVAPPPTTAWGQPGWAAAPAGPIHAPPSLCPWLSWKPDTNSEYTLSSSGDISAYISSPSCMCWGMPGLSSGSAFPGRTVCSIGI